MRKRYSEETKAAVIAALLKGQSVSSIAKEYKIPKQTVSGWKRREIADFATQKKETSERIGDLLMEYLAANLDALRVQVEAFTDEKWLAKQTASDAAVLHGVMTDKAIRLLEAMSNARVTDTKPD